MKKTLIVLTDFLLVTKSEFRKIFSDAGVMILLFGATFLYPLIYSIAYNNETLSDLPVAVVDQDNSALSRRLIRMADATQQVKTIRGIMDFNEAQTQMQAGKVQGILFVPAGFSKCIAKGEKATISIYTDAGYAMLYKQVYQGLARCCATFGAGIQLKKLAAKGIPENAGLDWMQPVKLVDEALYNPTGGYGSYAMPALLILILQQTLLLGIGMVGGTEREKKGLLHLIPFKGKRAGATRMLLGRSAAYFILYLSISFYLLFLIIRWFRFPQQGNPADIFFFTIPFLLSCIFLGFFLASFFRNRENSMIVLLFTSVPFIFLSGFSWPREAMPGIFVWFSHLIPSTSGIQGFIKINQMGAQLSDIKPELLELWLLAMVYFILAALAFRRQIKKAA